MPVVVVVVVGIEQFRSPGWHQADSNFRWYWSLCLFHSWPHRDIAQLQARHGDIGSIVARGAVGHLILPAGLCQAEADSQIPHLKYRKEQETCPASLASLFQQNAEEQSRPGQISGIQWCCLESWETSGSVSSSGPRLVAVTRLCIVSC